MLTNGQIIVACIITITLVGLGVVAESIWEMRRGPEEGAVAANQVLSGKEGEDAYDAMRVASANVATKIIWGTIIGGIVITWGIVAYLKFGSEIVFTPE